MDLRERIVMEVCNRMSSNGMNEEDVCSTKMALEVTLEKYEIQERCTEVATVEQTDYDILRMYASCMLTEGKSRKTVEAYLYFLKRYVGMIGVPIREVNTYTIRTYLAKLQMGYGCRQISMRTVENYRSYLSAFYMWMFKEELIQVNPMDRIPPIKYPDKERKEFSEVELDALRSACDTLRRRAILEMLLTSGVRVNELCSMDKSDIDFQNLEVLVRYAKGGKTRKTYINSVCAVHLKAYLNSRKDNEKCLIVNKMGNRITKRNVWDCLKVIGKKAMVENVHPHRCRRTFATTMWKKGMDIRTIQVLLGHTSLETTTEYVNTDTAHVRNEYLRYS